MIREILAKSCAVGVAATVAMGGLTGCSTTTSTVGGGSTAAQRQSLDASVDSTLSRLYAQHPGARDLVDKASGTLVLPAVVSAGFVVGGSYGQGALRVKGRPTQYYSAAAGSVGLLAGAESKAVILLFMTREALEKFQASNGWTVGADAEVTLVSLAANAQIDTETARRAVIGFVLTNGGLMANLSLEGTKFARLSW